MGSYNRIIIALFLLICLISVGRGNDKCAQRGDLRECRTTTPTPTASSPTTSTPTTSTPTTSTPTTSTPTTSTPTTSTPSPSTPTPSTPTPLTPTPLTLTPLTSTPLTPSPSTPTTSTPTPLTPTPSTPTPLTPTPLTPTPLTSTPLTPTTSTPTPSTPTPSTPTPSTSTLSTLPGETEAVTEIGTTIIREESSRTTPTQQTLTRSTSAPESTNGITQNAVWTTVSRKAKSAALGVTIVHSGVTEDTGTETGVDVSTGGEGFTTHEVDTTSTPTTSTPTQSTPTQSTPTTSTPTLSTSTPSTPTPSTSTLSTPLGETEVVTEIGTTRILEESSRTTPTQQTLTRSTSAPDSTNGITQNAVWTTVSREAKPTALGVTTVHSGVTEDTGNGTGVDVSTGGEGFTTREVHVALTSDGVDTTTGPLGGDLLSEGTTLEDPTNRNRLTVITTKTLTTSDHGTTVTLTTSEGQTTSSLLSEIAERGTTAPLQTSPLATSERASTSLPHTSLPPTTPERATTTLLQTSPFTTSKRVTTSVVDTSLPPTTPERLTTAPLQTSSAKNCQRGDVLLCRIATSTPTASTPTTSTLTTSEGETTSVLHTSPPPAERATTAPLQTSSAKNCGGDLFLCRIAATPTASTPTTSTLTTSEGETTSVLHTSPPPAERTTTAQQPTTSSQASTASPSTTHVAQTTAHDESQESRGDESQESPEDESMNQISWTDLAEEDRENILTLSFNDITEDDWMMNYDLKFRQFLSKILTTNTLRVVPGNIYYIEPTPFQRGDILYVSVLPRYSSMKRSAQRSVPLNETLGALDLAALKDALGIDTVPSIIEGVPEFLLPTALPTTDLPITQSLEEREPPIMQPSTTEPPIIQPSTTRKPPQKIGFLSNPGLFISLVVIATVSIIIIIVGLIYLLCDRRRGRTGEYITNHTPRNSDLELGLDNPVMAENDKNVSNGNHLSSIKGDMESDMIVPYDNFTQEELMNYEVEDTHL